MPTNIPQARKILKEVLNSSCLSDEDREQIAYALSMMKRNVVNPNKRRVSSKVTSEMVGEVLAYINDPQAPEGGYTDHEIGNAVNVNPGRVSEIRNGLRTVDQP